jgi:hypothetical protein
MGALASYFPAMEEVEQDFLNAGLLVESRVASERADDDVTELGEIHATLEALAVSMEATLEADPWTPVFINHALDSFGRRTGLKLPVASLEDATVTISMESIGGAIKAIWDAIVKAVKAALKAVADFFRRIYELVAGKRKKIEAGFAKAKKEGDSTPSKLADTNNLSKVADAEIEAFKKKLKTPELVKCRKDQLVALTPAAATVIDRANILDGNQTIPREEITHGGEVITLVRREDVKRAKYVKLCQAGNDFIAHASVAGISLAGLKEHRCEISIADVTEVVWECLYRGKEIREVGNNTSTAVQEISRLAIAKLKGYFAKDRKNNPGDFHFSSQSDAMNAEVLAKFEAIRNEFKRITGKDGWIPAGRRVVKFLEPKNVYHLFPESNAMPELAKFTENEVLLNIPTWSEAKKASDGVTSLLILNTQKDIITVINIGFDRALDEWNAAIKWVGEQGYGDKTPVVTKYFTDYCKLFFTDIQTQYNRFLRSQLAMEGTAIQWANVLSGTMARLADAKSLVEEIA